MVLLVGRLTIACRITLRKAGTIDVDGLLVGRGRWLFGDAVF